MAILSGGETLLGVLHVPTGAGPHPVVVLLHGFPGNERNFDLAQALRRAGYGSLVFHYRGSWGVAGSYSWATVLEDAARVVTAVREKDFAASHRLDATRAAVVGAVVSVACLDFGAAVASATGDAWSCGGSRRAWPIGRWPTSIWPPSWTGRWWCQIACV